MRTSLISQLPEVRDFIAQKPRTQKEIAEYFSVDRQTAKRAADRLSVYTTLTESKEGRNIVYSLSLLLFIRMRSLRFPPRRFVRASI